MATDRSGDEQDLRRLTDEPFITTDASNYRLTARRGPGGWRLDGFRYYSKLTRGNDALRTREA